jgi:hypothetical protein
LTGIRQNVRKPGDAPVHSVNAAFFDDLPPTLINEFRDIGSGVSGGLPLQPWAAELKKQRMAENSKDNPDAHCLPLGNVQLHTHVEPRRILQTPWLVAIIYEANYGLRQIYLDGRPAPDNSRNPGGTATRGVAEKGRRSSSRRRTSGTVGGSTSTGAR